MKLSPAQMLILTATDGLVRGVAEGLARRPKQLASKYLYDALGSQLFEAICELPWYKVTRGERILLERARDTIVSRLGDPATIIELGGGSGEKLALLVDALERQGRSTRTHLVDISPTALALSRRTLSRHASATVLAHQATYMEGLRTALADPQGNAPAMVLFLGSNIGNLDLGEAHRFLRDIRMRLRAGDWLLLGADLVKPAQELVLAYDDPLGVTAAFNKNLLARLNRELAADFDLEQFEYRVLWNAEASRIESYLVSLAEQTVCITGAGCCVRFEAGEEIFTESSYKYEPAQIVVMGEIAGFASREQWVEPESRFALTLFESV